MPRTACRFLRAWRRHCLLGLMFFSCAIRIKAATYNVTVMADTADAAAPYSLRDAILLANSTASSDTIVLPAGTFELTLGPADLAGKGPTSFVPASGDLDIRNPVTIQGAGINLTVIDGKSLDRIFDCHGASLTLRDVTLQKGQTPVGFPAEGAGVLLRGTDYTGAKTGGKKLSLINSRLRNHSSPLNGGAVGVRSTAGQMANRLEMTDCTLTSNTALDGGGAVALHNCTAQIRNSVFVFNKAQTTIELGFGGGALLVNCGSGNAVTLEQCAFTSNTSLQEGGAIAHQSGSLTVTACTMTGNRADRHGGGYGRSVALNVNPVSTTIKGSNATGNKADANNNGSGSGGAFYNAASGVGSTMNVSFTRMFANQANIAADIFAQGTGAAVVAQNNWWGSNAAPATVGTAGGAPAITLTPRLQLSLAVAPTVISPLGTSVLTASLNKNSAAANVGGVFSNFVANTTPVKKWIGSAGVATGNSLFTGGVATGQFKANAVPASGLAGIQVDNQILNQAVVIGNGNAAENWELYK